MQKEISIIDRKRWRLFHLICGVFLLIMIPFYMVDHYRNMNFFHWLFILGMSINGSVQIYLGLLSTRVYIKLDADYLTIKWDNKVRREIVSLHMIDYVILNDWNFELKLSDGQSKKFSCGSLKYNQVIDVKAYLEENFSKKIKYGE